MNDLVERLREIGAHYSACDRQQTIYEAADALEAAKARIEAVRRETVEECARVARECFADPQAEADPEYIPAAIRALTEAKEDRT